MPSQVAITLSSDQMARLDAIAEARHASSSDVAAEAVSQYLQNDAQFRSAVEDGLRAGAAGDVMDFDIFAAEMRRRMAIDAGQSRE